jgi:hypothetical protein
MDEKTPTLSDTELDRVTGGRLSREFTQKWEEKEPPVGGSERLSNIVGWIKGFFS